MTESENSAVVRSASCKANLDSDYPTCERCGLAWHRADPPPACQPMNFDRLRLVLLAEAAALEGSHHAVVKMREAGMPADPVAALRRATALRGVLLVIDRCADSQVIKNELRRIAREIEAAAIEEAQGKIQE